MFIIICSVTAQTEQIILWDFSGTKKRSQLAQNHLFQKKFFFLLDMMHPIIPSANVKQQRYSQTNNMGFIVSKTGEVLLSIVTLTHSLALTFPWHCGLTSLRHSSHKKGKISAQPHTISLFSLFKNCMHDEIWGCCAEIMPIPNLKRKKERKRRSKC